MNKKIRKKLMIFLSEIFDRSDMLEYVIVDFNNTEDKDLNFLITPKIDIFEQKEGDKFNFIIYCSDESMITIYCPTLYRITDKDSSMYTLNAINVVNSKIAVGKVYLNQKNNAVISYINRILFNDLTKELTVDLLEDYIASFFITSIEFYKQMREFKHD